jgi:hypothetical protein
MPKFEKKGNGNYGGRLIPDYVIGFFTLSNSSSARVDSACNRNEYQESSGSKGLPALEA